MGERYNNLSNQEKNNITFGWEIPLWLRVFRTISHPDYPERNKRLLRPMLESDPVVKFLNTIKWKVDDLITEQNKELDIDIEFDGWQTDNIKRETKHEFIAHLQSFIKGRELTPFAVAWSIYDKGTNYRFSDHFDDLIALYNFLLRVSERNEEEIKNFILNEIPSFSWDKNFWMSK